jgi:hypothetical protein
MVALPRFLIARYWLPVRDDTKIGFGESPDAKTRIPYPDSAARPVLSWIEFIVEVASDL